MAQIGIVTVLYNSSNVLDDFFSSLDKQTYNDFVLYIVNNNSSDDSLDKCYKLSETVSFKTKIMNENTNWGVAKGNNIGIINALADGCEYVLLSNNDIVLQPDTIENLLVGLQNSKAEMAVPKIFFHDVDLLWAAGGCFSYFKGSTPHYGYKQPDDGRFDTMRFIKYAPTCFMLISYEVFCKIGLMDEKYFVYYDDSDFVWRATRCNKLKLAYIPSSTLRHKESSCTGGGRSDFSIYYSSRNRIYFVLKNMRFLQKALTISYYYLHTLLRKPFIYSKDQMNLIWKATSDGISMYKHSFPGK